MSALHGMGDAVRLDPVRVDRGLALVLFAGAELQVWLGSGSLGHRVGAAAACGAVTLSVAVRRRFPVAVGLGVQGLLAVCTVFVALPAGPLTIAWFCALYALAVWTSTVWFAFGLAFVAVSNLVPQTVSPGKLRTVVVFTLGVIVVMVLVRRVLADRERRVELAERERDLAAREAVVEERARIARELHGAIAHDVSAMVERAGAERRAGESRSPHEALHAIEQAGRGALVEMRRIVGALRGEDEQGSA
jgi:signal transduction histidine kinase